MALNTTHLRTTGMHCSSCSMLIDMTLREMAGVDSSATDHATGSTIVTYDDTKVSISAIIEAIRSAGYDAETT